MCLLAARDECAGRVDEVNALLTSCCRPEDCTQIRIDAVWIGTIEVAFVSILRDRNRVSNSKRRTMVLANERVKCSVEIHILGMAIEEREIEVPRMAKVGLLTNIVILIDIVGINRDS